MQMYCIKNGISLVGGTDDNASAESTASVLLLGLRSNLLSCSVSPNTDSGGNQRQ